MYIRYVVDHGLQASIFALCNMHRVPGIEYLYTAMKNQESASLTYQTGVVRLQFIHKYFHNMHGVNKQTSL